MEHTRNNGNLLSDITPGRNPASGHDDPSGQHEHPSQNKSPTSTASPVLYSVRVAVPEA